MNGSARKTALEAIQRNIKKHGHHIYVVTGAPSPRYAYTIGLKDTVGTELILAGGISYMVDDVTRIINDSAKELEKKFDWRRANLQIDSLGMFSFREMHPSWTKMMMLGAIDFYGTSEIDALQIIPDADHATFDIPDLGRPWDAVTEPVWQWLREPWTYPVSRESTAVTNLAALRGERVTEAARWEEDQWELFAGAGPDVPKEDVRVVPLGTLLGLDKSLYPVTELKIGQGFWRDPVELKWHPWRQRSSGTTE
jgi:hypothetical protein